MSTNYAMRSADIKPRGFGGFINKFLTPGIDDAGSVHTPFLAGETLYGWTYPDDPLIPNWPTGDFVVAIDSTIIISDTFANDTFNIRLERVDENGVVIEATAEQVFIPFGVPTTVTFTGVSWGKGEKDHQLRARLVQGSTDGQYNVTKVEVNAPWTFPAARTWEMHIAGPVVYDQTYEAPPAAWLFPWEFPPYIIQAADVGGAVARLRMLEGMGL